MREKNRGKSVRIEGEWWEVWEIAPEPPKGDKLEKDGGIMGAVGIMGVVGRFVGSLGEDWKNSIIFFEFF